MLLVLLDKLGTLMLLLLVSELLFGLLTGLLS